MFTPSRLTLARKRRGLTKTRLADQAGVTLRAITDFESGAYDPIPETLSRLARVLQFPVEFFSGPELAEPTPDTASFRSMSRMTASKRDAALGAGALAILLNEWIEERFGLPRPALPDLRDTEPEAAAMSLRTQWELGERSIKNMVHLLEAKGVRVYSLAEDSKDVDAFSLWHGDTPFVFLNTLKSAERSRFDAAHELGHLVLHRHGGPQGPEGERQADAFASAFLMPRGSIFAHAPKMPSLSHLIELKKRWIVSVAALNRRLKDLGILSEWHYRTICIEIAQRGYQTQEPEGAQPETSQVLEKIFSHLRKDGVTKASVAQALNLNVEDLEKLVFGLTLRRMPGGMKTASSPTERPDLKIIK